jgi:N6-L-threonylcarbamoyladenine synthase
MIILSIETSCDETAISIVEATGDFPHATYKVLGNALFSQIDIHREYGGVFPAVAKREHARTLVPMLVCALQEAELLGAHTEILSEDVIQSIHAILSREPGLGDALVTFFNTHGVPPIDLIAVTSGPGLEPALWVGISFARALASFWNVPVVPVNHMEGHVFSSIFTNDRIPPISFPALTLLISGGHTELVLIKSWAEYERIGATRDDAVGEAFDKVARMLGLQYPGGPEISTRARSARERNLPQFAKLPRPMIDSDNLDFSFSGLKTAVRYAIADKELNEGDVAAIARDFEDSVTEVLLKKTYRAVAQHGIQTLIIGGGVSANAYIREKFSTYFETEHPDVAVYFPPRELSTDNSVMIALAGHAHAHQALTLVAFLDIQADGNLSL